MVKVYTNKWNGFQFREPVYLDGHIEPYEFDLVKWEETEPRNIIDGITDENKTSTEFCFSIGHLIWNPNEQDFYFESVGMRYFEHRIDGLEKWIMKFSEFKRVELEEY